MMSPSSVTCCDSVGQHWPVSPAKTHSGYKLHSLNPVGLVDGDGVGSFVGGGVKTGESDGLTVGAIVGIEGDDDGLLEGATLGL